MRLERVGLRVSLASSKAASTPIQDASTLGFAVGEPSEHPCISSPCTHARIGHPETFLKALRSSHSQITLQLIRMDARLANPAESAKA
jgi:hypothetical protein